MTHIKNYKSNNIRGKLKVHLYLLQSKELKFFLPRTHSFSLQNLKKMLLIFPVLYIKPDVGSQGIGIYKVKTRGKQYILYSTKKSESFYSPFSLFRAIKKRTTKKMIIQQGISLETVDGRPYDIRSMVQRKPGGRWTSTGMFAKVGKPNKIVTNYYQGGKIVLMNKLYAQTAMTEHEIEERLRLLSETSRKVALFLSRKRKGMYEMGIDFAFDDAGRLWILEVNSRFPQFYPLRRLDRTMYRRMLSFAKSIGRTKA